jgi:transmembrane sensor
MEHQKAEGLFEKYRNGETTEEENALLESWYLDEVYKSAPVDGIDYETKEEKIWAKIKQQRKPIKTTPIWPRVAIAAAAVVAMALCIYFFIAPPRPDTSSSRTAGRDLLNDIAPGRNGATITLANGKVIPLSDQKKGVVVGESLTYNDGSDVRYSSGTSSSGSLKGSQNSTGPVGGRSLATGSEMQNLTASTGKGQNYQVTLPDGTKVWLNADSKISFPSQFNGKERKILLTGEAYFVVKHNAKQPFRVESKGQTVEDIGTEFNINAYPDESNTRTTLVEGSAKVNEVILKPNQQSVVKGNDIKVQAADTELAVAWKNGVFQFYRADLKTVMKALSRWYDVEVEYQGVTPEREFTGKIFKNVTASQALGLLKDLDVKFRIEGKKIIVTP